MTPLELSVINGLNFLALRVYLKIGVITICMEAVGGLRGIICAKCLVHSKCLIIKQNRDFNSSKTASNQKGAVHEGLQEFRGEGHSTGHRGREGGTRLAWVQKYGWEAPGGKGRPCPGWVHHWVWLAHWVLGGMSINFSIILQLLDSHTMEVLIANCLFPFILEAQKI